jgi:hypothetical protein
MPNFQYPPEAPVRKYRVIFIDLDGKERSYPVITNRGPLKAVWLASSPPWRFFRANPLEIRVEDDGEPELDDEGTPKLSGSAIDRQEW